MRPCISIRGSFHPSVGPSVRPSVGQSVTLSSKSREIIIFEQISDRRGILGSLYASSHLYKMVSWSIGLSSICLSHFREYQQKSTFLASSCNHIIIPSTLGRIVGLMDHVLIFKVTVLNLVFRSSLTNFNLIIQTPMLSFGHFLSFSAI